MKRGQKWVLLLLFCCSLGSSWWLLYHSKAAKNHKWFQQKVVQQQKQNADLKRHNQLLKRRVMALKYDHRVIERTARDHLSLTREGEIILILPR